MELNLHDIRLEKLVFFDKVNVNPIMKTIISD